MSRKPQANSEWRKRYEAFALELHPDKTRIIEFGRFAHENRRARGQGKPETSAFLGLTHIFGRTREGRRLIWRHTLREELNAKLRQVKATLRGMRHLPVPAQGRYLRKMMRIAERWLPSPGYGTLSRLAVRRHDPRQKARCVSSARRDLCGGRRAIAVPTAMHQPIR